MQAYPGKKSLKFQRISTLAGDKKILRITSKAIPVRDEPKKTSLILCQLVENVYVKAFSEITVDSVVWFRVACGWIAERDSTGFVAFSIGTEFEATRSWAKEADNRRRIASSVASMLTRSYSLTDSRRVSRSILNYSKPAGSNPSKLSVEDEVRPMSSDLNILEEHKTVKMNLPDVNIEDIIIGLSASTGLRQREIFDFVNIVASQQSNPPRVVVEICEEVDRIINLRPSVWVKMDLNVLPTVDLKAKNNQFVMAAAHGDLILFNHILSCGQEPVALHSQLGYTALHAAADFGAIEIVRRLVGCGISMNIRDTRLQQTALHFAAQSGRENICELLLEHGADRVVRNVKGLLASHLAEQQGHLRCREMLKFWPPTINHVSVVDAHTRSITVCWSPPAFDERLHSPVLEYAVEWKPAAGSGPTVRFSAGVELSYTVENLQPCSGHGLAVLSRSLAGWSKPSSKIVAFTQSCEPEAPSVVEILKIATNGMLISWLPPPSENGAPVDHYQLEIVDDAGWADVVMAEEAQAAAEAAAGPSFRSGGGSGPASEGPEISHIGFAESDDGGSVGSLGSLVSSIASARDDDFSDNDSLPSPRSQPSAASDNTSVPSKRNSAPSPSAPSAANSANSVLKFNNRWHRIVKHRNPSHRERYLSGLEPDLPYRLRVRCRNELGFSRWSDWTPPVAPQPGVFLLSSRSVGATTFCRLGWFVPMLAGDRTVTGFEVQQCLMQGPMQRNITVYVAKAFRSNAVSTMSFETIESALEESELEVPNLQAGGRYTFRVRPQIDGVFVEWGEASMTSNVITIPACAPDAPFGLGVAAIEGESGELDITHDCAVIKWTNGASNGAPVLEFEFYAAKVREYQSKDLEAARVGATVETSGDEGGVDISPAPSGAWTDSGASSLCWVEVTSSGDVLGPQAFRARGLSRGASYVFRVRQRNSVGWSPFSAASGLVTTFLTTAPQPPKVHSLHPYHFTVDWDPYSGDDEQYDFTVLEYNVQIATVSTRFKIKLEEEQDSSAKGSISYDWSTAVTRELDASSTFGNEYQGCGRKAILVDKLSASKTYVLRVKVRTVAGWSTWSCASCEMKTLSTP